MYTMDNTSLRKTSILQEVTQCDYKANEQLVIKPEDRDKPYTKSTYCGYSSFRPNSSISDGYLPNKNDLSLDDRKRLSNWNRRFRHCIWAIRNLEPTAQLAPRIEANLNLMHLSQDFIYAATSYGKIIISEYYLPVKNKTIKPIELGGVLGGQKYIVHNILFKFAVDASGLFGGEFAAAKVAGNELRGLMGFFNCHINQLNLPLLALVDYRGFRLIAMSILPVGKDTIIYGSCDAGRNIHATDPELNKLMAKAAKMQNLKPHECRIAKKNISRGKVIFESKTPGKEKENDELRSTRRIIDFASISDSPLKLAERPHLRRRSDIGPYGDTSPENVEETAGSNNSLQNFDSNARRSSMPSSTFSLSDTGNRSVISHSAGHVITQEGNRNERNGGRRARDPYRVTSVSDSSASSLEISTSTSEEVEDEDWFWVDNPTLESPATRSTGSFSDYQKKASSDGAKHSVMRTSSEVQGHWQASKDHSFRETASENLSLQESHKDAPQNLSQSLQLSPGSGRPTMPAGSSTLFIPGGTSPVNMLRRRSTNTAPAGFSPELSEYRYYSESLSGSRYITHPSPSSPVSPQTSALHLRASPEILSKSMPLTVSESVEPGGQFFSHTQPPTPVLGNSTQNVFFTPTKSESLSNSGYGPESLDSRYFNPPNSPRHEQEMAISAESLEEGREDSYGSSEGGDTIEEQDEDNYSFPSQPPLTGYENTPTNADPIATNVTTQQRTIYGSGSGSGSGVGSLYLTDCESDLGLRRSKKKSLTIPSGIKKRRAVLAYQYGNYDAKDQKVDEKDLWDRTELMYSPADLEGHKGYDGRFYLLDFSRVLPPETPNPLFKNSHLSRLLRPEFVKEYHKPLCSDAFSGFIKGTAGEEEHNREIEEATNYLFNILIPKFAKELQRLMLEAREQGRLNRFRLTEAAHSAGVNCRHFGIVRKLIPEPDFKEVLLLEITARCIKNSVRWKFREKMRQIALPMEEPYRRLVINHFNLIFGNSKMSDGYWDEILKQDCIINFSESLSEEELQPTFHLKLRKPNSEINTEFLYSLYSKVTQMLGMKFGFGPSRASNFLNKEPFDDTDLDNIGEHVKHMNIISHAQGYFYHVKGLANRIEDPEVARNFYGIAIEKFSEALNSDPNNKEILLSMSLTWTLMIEDSYKHIPNAKFERSDPKVKKAEEYSLRAIFAEPKYDSFSLFRYAQFLEKCGRFDDAEDYYLMALEADPDNAGCLHCYGSLLSDRGFEEDAEKFFRRASQQTIGLSQWPQWYH
eukprot:TRINITY_DN2779_c1_g2_i1.p1 TRINITY_DN2779_c1_g2~~TRINITY_DN2779_c1_g2_i1.p1  ORF type:complete len:1346 (-),score=201.42 TRINITY_DN2779_c1_g2_i1:119-3904(-)